MFPSAVQVAQLLDPDESISCSLCGSANNRCKDCVKLLKRRRNMNDVTKRLFKLQNKNQTGKEKGEGRGAGKKTPLNWKSIRKSCSKAKESQPSVGWENWRRGLLEKANPSQQEKDAVLLIEAFDDPLLGWMLLEYSEADKFISRPCRYREILLYIMKTSQSTDSGPNRPDMAVQSSHKVTPNVATMPTTQLQHGDTAIEIEAADSPSSDFEQQTEEVQAVYPHNSSSLPTQSFGMIHSNAQAAWEGQAGERSGVNAHTQLASGPVQRNLKRSNGEESSGRKRVRLQSEQPDTYKTTSAVQAIFTSVSGPEQEPYMPTSPGRIHPLLLGPDASLIEQLYPNLELVGQVGCTEQSDCSLIFLWPGYSASLLLGHQNSLSNMGPAFWKGRIAPSLLEKLPFKPLIESIMCSETWKKQPQDCFTIWLQRPEYFGDFSLLLEKGMAMVSCIVPRHRAVETTF